MLGCFLTIEGCEGAGKTTALNFIKQWMLRHDLKFIETREPGGTRVAEELRYLLLNHDDEVLSDTTELLMMFAARSQNLFHNIEPGLAKGKIVLCDRFTDSTYAYQGGGRGLDQSNIEVLEKLVQRDLRPDMTILMDVDPAVGLSRVQGRVGDRDCIEQEKIDFFIRVRTSYQKRVEQFPERFEMIDAGQSFNDVQQQILSVLNRRFGM